MAIDTAQKRAAAVGARSLFRPLVLPSGGIGTAVLRAQVVGLYIPTSGGGGGGSPAPLAFLQRIRRHKRSAMTTLTPIKG